MAMEMTPVCKERKRKSPFPLFPHWLGKLAKIASFPHSHSFGDDLEFLLSSSSFNFNFDEKCYPLARYLLLPTSPVAQQVSSMGSGGICRFSSTLLRTPLRAAIIAAFTAAGWGAKMQTCALRG
jgi:hypothetical protein